MALPLHVVAEFVPNHLVVATGAVMVAQGVDVAGEGVGADLEVAALFLADAPERVQAVRRVASNPKIFKQLEEHFDTTPPKPPENRPGVKRAVLPLDDGEAVFEWPETIGSEGAEDISQWLDLLESKVRRSAGLPRTGNDD